MLSNISKALSEGEFSSDVQLSLDGIQIDEDNLILTFQVTCDLSYEKLQVWKVICTDFREHRFNVSFFEEFEVLDDHVYLWNINNNLADLYFKGQCSDIMPVIGELFITHSSFVNGLFPLENYLNNKIVNLLNKGEGLFSKGPVNLIKEHAKVLSGNGYKTSIIEFSTKEKNSYKILIFGDSFVIANDFQAIQVL